MIDNSYADVGGSYDFGGFDDAGPSSFGAGSSPAPVADSFGTSDSSDVAASFDNSFVGPPAPVGMPAYSADDMAGDFAREQNRFTALPSFSDTSASSTTTSYTGGADWAADVAARRSSLDWWTTPAAVDTTPTRIEVQSGDSLSRIADRLAGDSASAGTVNDLKNGFIAANPQLSNPNLLQVGDWLNVPNASTVFDSPAFARATAADTQYLAARQPAPAWGSFGFSSGGASGLAFGGSSGGLGGFGAPSFLDTLGATASLPGSGFGHSFSQLSGTAAPAPLSLWDRAGAHALGVYDAGVGALDGAAHSFGVVGTPESRAAWAVETSRATIDGLRSFFNDPGGSVSRWWSNLTGDDPAAIRQATVLPASLGIGLATGYAGSARGLGGLRGLSHLDDGLPSLANTSIASPGGFNLRAIAAGAEDLTPTQASVLAQLEGNGARVLIPKQGFGQNDLAALAAATGNEFAMFTTGGRRLVVRGSADGIPIGIADGTAQELAAQGWRWSSHVHPDGVLRSSVGDRAVLDLFRNQRSAILDPLGGRSLFSPAGDMLSPNWLP